MQLFLTHVNVRIGEETLVDTMHLVTARDETHAEDIVDDKYDHYRGLRKGITHITVTVYENLP